MAKPKKGLEKLYIVIPAYNESENIEQLVEDWYPVIESINKESRLVIIDDGSKDDTYEKLKKLSKGRPQLICKTKPNAGHGATVLYGYNFALEQGADYVFQTDSDGQTLPSEFPQFWDLRKEYDMVIGHRKGREDGIARVFVTKVLRFVVRLCFGAKVTDANTPFRLMTAKSLEENIKYVPKNFNLSNVILSVIYVKRRQKVKFIPITFRPRGGGVNSINLPKIFKIGKQALSDFRSINKSLKKIEKDDGIKRGHGDILPYLFFGICTTLVNIVSYWLAAHIFHLNTIIATSIAWFVAVAFAYITNRKWVFHSKAKGAKEIAAEIGSFFVCRLLTGLLDVAIMYIFVDRLSCNDVIVKTISNIIVIIANYVASRLLIFNKEKNNSSLKITAIIAALFLMSFGLAQLSGWGVMKHKDGFIDANVYKYVGQVIRDGGMPYRDVFDHKGPLMYLFQAAGGYINEYNGSWIFELASIFVTACAFYLIARLLKCKPWQALLATLVPLTLLESMLGGTFGAGACCCQFAMPFVAISLYIFLKYFITGKVKNLSIWLCGLCFGSVLMLRPNIVAVWAVFCIAILVKLIREKQLKELPRFLISFILGVATIIIPIIVWLAANGAMTAFFEQFIEFNLFYSGNGINIIDRAGAAAYFFSFPAIAFAAAYMIYRIVVHRKEIDIIAAIYLGVNIAFASMSGRAWHHYAIVLLPSIIYPYAMLFASLPSQIRKKDEKTYSLEKSAVVVMAIAILSITVIPVWSKIAKSDLDSFKRRDSSLYDNDYSTKMVVEAVKKYTDEGDKIQAFGHLPIIYNLSNRRAATRYMYTTGEILKYKNVREELFSTLETEKPKVIVVSPSDYFDKDMEAFIKENNYNLVFPEDEDGTLVEPDIHDTGLYVFYRPAAEK